MAFTPGNGLDHQPQLDVYSMFFQPIFLPEFVIYWKRLTTKRALSTQHDQGLRVYITGDAGDVYEDAFRKIAISKDNVFTPTLVLVGIRLGIERVTPVYWEALKSSLMMPQSVGIAGCVYMLSFLL